MISAAELPCDAVPAGGDLQPGVTSGQDRVNIYHSQHCPLDILNLDVDTIGIFYIDTIGNQTLLQTDFHKATTIILL